MAKEMKNVSFFLLILVLLLFLVSCTQDDILTGKASVSSGNQLRCLKDYEIGAYVSYAQGQSVTQVLGEYTVNGNWFRLNRGQVQRLPNGARFYHKDYLYQAYTGGAKGPSFHLEGACTTQYT